jgi:hypothetical protein
MAARANWKGVLKIGEVSCPVALYTAASTAERIAFHILNRKTGHRVHRDAPSCGNRGNGRGEAAGQGLRNRRRRLHPVRARGD